MLNIRVQVNKKNTEISGIIFATKLVLIDGQKGNNSIVANRVCTTLRFIAH